jgi:hypothetical protein
MRRAPARAPVHAEAQTREVVVCVGRAGAASATRIALRMRVLGLVIVAIVSLIPPAVTNHQPAAGSGQHLLSLERW